jgi:hypothetical protein
VDFSGMQAHFESVRTLVQQLSRKSERMCGMKTIKCCGLIVVWLCLGQLGAQTYNNVRMAYINPQINEPIPTRFYERARADGFNYVLAEFILNDTDWIKTGSNAGRYNWARAGKGLHKQLRTEFIVADNYGLKLIPLFQTSNVHSEHWKGVNPNIGWQKLPTVVRQDVCKAADETVPTFAPDYQGVNGFDTSFKDLLSVIYSAFNTAHQDKPTFSYKNLDYIHFGADEPSFQFTIKNGADTLDMLMVGMCQNDKDWLSKTGLSGHSVKSRVLGLMAENIRRKIRMINEAGRNHSWYNDTTKHNTTALYYGDMLDPNHTGGANRHLCTFSSLSTPDTLQTTPIKTYSLADSLIKAIKDSSMVVQWWYDEEYGGKDYDTDSTFRYFAHKGLTFLHGNALADNSSLINYSRLHQFMEQAVVSTDPKFNDFVMGFVSFHWCGGQSYYNNNKDWNGQVPSYKTMEFLSHILWHNAALLE